MQCKNQQKLHAVNIFWLGLAHFLVIVALFHFTLNALWVCLFGVFVLSPLGVNLGFHRLLTHRSLKAPQWLEYTLVTLGAVLGGGPPLHWVAEHRLHHRFSDTPSDPHNAGRGFWYSHVGHLFFHKDFEDNEEQWMKYVPELSSNRYYLFLNRAWIPLSILTLVPLYLLGGMPFVLWGGFVRAVTMLHLTWFVNSASHLWGYRTYKNKKFARNCWWVGLLAAGEGWHNNHHESPTSAAHGHRWWEIDTTYYLICLLEKMGLATQVKRPIITAPIVSQRVSSSLISE
jgi:fatty-acid desaturase